ncbi:MAG: hypothetical protein ACPF9D_10520, partial [Owenweeksia sp.]
MELIYPFNQMEFLQSIMRIDGWEEALIHGSCSAISFAFADFYFHSPTHDLVHFFEVLEQNSAILANEQTRAIEQHQLYLEGYDFLLQQHGLTWQGTEYPPDELQHNFTKGN